MYIFYELNQIYLEIICNFFGQIFSKKDEEKNKHKLKLTQSKNGPDHSSF